MSIELGKDTYLYDATSGEMISGIDVISGLEFSRNVIDATTHGSGLKEEKIIGIRKTGPLTVRAVYDQNNTGTNRLVERFVSGEAAEYVIVFPQKTTVTFTGFVINVGHEIKKDDVVKRSFRFQPDGITEPEISNGSFCGDYFDYTHWACEVDYDIEEWV